ncbi:MAG: DUF1801 domain-containing protein [Balneolaceae bacterium]|nr:DUF1801 domain-containing protein [Balneolaceae bacterium]
MSDNKTSANEGDVDAYLNGLEDDQQRLDSFVLLELMKEVTGKEPKMWGGTIVGFGQYHYKYESGREGDWFLTGFAPRKGKLSIYIMAGFDDYHKLLEELGPHKTGQSCLYLKTLENADMEVLRRLVKRSVEYMRKNYKDG